MKMDEASKLDFKATMDREKKKKMRREQGLPTGDEIELPPPRAIKVAKMRASNDPRVLLEQAAAKEQAAMARRRKAYLKEQAAKKKEAVKRKATREAAAVQRAGYVTPVKKTRGKK